MNKLQWLKKSPEIFLPSELKDFDFVAAPENDPDTKDFIENPVDNIESNPFMYSLENLHPDDIAEPEPKHKITAYDIIYTTVRYSLLAICITVFIGSAYTIIKNLAAYRQAEDLYSSLGDDLFSEESFDFVETNSVFKLSPMLKKVAATPDYESALKNADNTLIEEVSNLQIKTYNERFERMKSKINALANTNPDTYGWIKIDNTVINYPMVQGEDNDFYLDHAYNGVSLPAGSIFVDYRNYKNILKNFNTVVYGHNMKNGLMFNGVTNYLDEQFFNDNPYVEVTTPEGIFTYEVFAIYEARYDYNYIQTVFTSYDEFVKYCYTLKSNSMYERKGMEFEEGDRILTLSTCTNGLWTQRYALHAKMIKREK